MSKPNNARGTKGKPAKGGKGRGRGFNLTLPMIAGGILRFIGILLLLMWRLLCWVTPPLPVWQRMAKSRITHRIAAAVLLMVLGLVALGVMRGSLAQGDRWKLDPARIEFTSLGLDWVTGDAAVAIRLRIDASLRESLKGISPASAFDSDIAATVGQRLAANPWVHSVNRVERCFPKGDAPSTLTVSLNLHRPVLRVPLNDRVYLVSRAPGTAGAGYVLPWAPVLQENRIPRGLEDQVIYAGLSPDVRMVTGVVGDAPATGTIWENEQVRAAISIEEDLRREKFEEWFPVASVDVYDIAPARRWDGQVAYTPLGGVRLFGRTTGSALPVIWGKPRVHASTVEIPPAAKIRRLRDAISADPTLQSFNPGLALNQ